MKSAKGIDKNGCNTRESNMSNNVYIYTHINKTWWLVTWCIGFNEFNYSQQLNLFERLLFCVLFQCRRVCVCSFERVSLYGWCHWIVYQMPFIISIFIKLLSWFAINLLKRCHFIIWSVTKPMKLDIVVLIRQTTKTNQLWMNE